MPLAETTCATTRAMARKTAGQRPVRGTPEATRERLVAAAARVFNRAGYHGTDTNRLARAAGYAPATFYKHFPDKRAVFLAAYDAWVTSEWTQVDRVVRDAKGDRAARIVALTLAHHRRWRGLRASLRALVATDADVRAAYRAQRRRQLALLAALRGPHAPLRRERDALLLFTMERTCDAVAEGEVRELGLSVSQLVAALEDEVRDALR
jgi:AcrR family transcriptional regulator